MSTEQKIINGACYEAYVDILDYRVRQISQLRRCSTDRVNQIRPSTKRYAYLHE